MLPGQSFTPGDFLNILRRRKWLLIVPLVIAVSIQFDRNRKLVNVYRSDTLIMVVPQRIPENYVRSTVTSSIEDRLQTIQQQILSRSRLEPVIEEFKLYPDQRTVLPMERVIEIMRSNVIVRLDRGSIFRLAFTHEDPQITQQVTERLASLFVAENLRDRETLADDTSQFLDEQLTEARTRLLEQEKRLEIYRRQNGGELPTQVQSNLQAIQSAQLQLQSLSEALNRDQERRLVLERQVAALRDGDPTLLLEEEAAGTPQPGPELPMARQLNEARDRLKGLELRYTAEHPDVLAARRQVQTLEIAAQQERAGVLANSARPGESAANAAQRAREVRLREARQELRNVEGQIAAKGAEEERLRAVIGDYQGKVDRAPTRESELIELTRDYGTLQNAYTGLLTKREESKISANLERRQVGEQFKVLDPPRVPELPVYPNRPALLGIAAAVGLGLGLILIVGLEYFDASFKTDDEVARVLQLPVLGVVPLMRSEREAVAHRRRKWLIGATTALFVVVTVGAYVALNQ